MRNVLTLLLATLISSMVQAQNFTKVLTGNNFVTAVSKVVENYPNNYAAIQGEMLPSDQDREIFRSIIIPPGAEQCVIYRFHSIKDTTASWECILYDGENFDEAAKAYKNAFRQVRQVKFKMGESKYGFTGELDEPNESLRFTTSILRPETNSDLYRNFIAEIEMVNSFIGWKVQLNLHSRKDDKERF